MLDTSCGGCIVGSIDADFLRPNLAENEPRRLLRGASTSVESGMVDAGGVGSLALSLDPPSSRQERRRSERWRTTGGGLLTTTVTAAACCWTGRRRRPRERLGRKCFLHRPCWGSAAESNCVVRFVRWWCRQDEGGASIRWAGADPKQIMEREKQNGPGLLAYTESK